MAKVAMLTDALKRRQTYEEVVEYIQTDPDKIKYPNRAAKLLRNTFQLSQLDGIGKELMEQQEIEEMKEILKDYNIHKLAIENNTDARTERARSIQDRDEPRTGRAIQDSDEPRPPKAIQQGSSSSTGMPRSIAGHVASGAGHVARGLFGVAGGVAGVVGSMVAGHHTTGEQTPPVTQRYIASPVQSELDDAVDDYETDRLQDWYERESHQSAKSEAARSSVQAHLEDVHQQHSGIVLPMMSSPSQSFYESPARSSSAAPTEHYIGSSPNIAQSPPVTIHSSPPVTVHSSPETIRSSPGQNEGHWLRRRRLDL